MSHRSSFLGAPFIPHPLVVAAIKSTASASRWTDSTMYPCMKTGGPELWLRVRPARSWQRTSTCTLMKSMEPPGAKWQARSASHVSSAQFGRKAAVGPIDKFSSSPCIRPNIFQSWAWRLEWYCVPTEPARPESKSKISKNTGHDTRHVPGSPWIHQPVVFHSMTDLPRPWSACSAAPKTGRLGHHG